MQCIVVKEGQRCQNDSKEFSYGVSLPLLRPDSPSVYICGVCIDDLYYVAHQVEQSLLPADQVKQEFRRA